MPPKLPPAPPPTSVHYRQLTKDERDFVDDQLRTMMRRAKGIQIRLDGAQPAEDAAEALARWVIESRPR